MKEEMPNDWNGYSLFIDIDDFELKARNRGTVLANIIEDNSNEKFISDKGLRMAQTYARHLPAFEMEAAFQWLRVVLTNRGWDIAREGVQ